MPQKIRRYKEAHRRIIEILDSILLDNHQDQGGEEKAYLFHVYEWNFIPDENVKNYHVQQLSCDEVVVFKANQVFVIRSNLTFEQVNIVQAK